MRRIVMCLVCSSLISCGPTPTDVAASAAELPLAEERPRPDVSALRVATIRMTGTDTTLLEVPAVARRGEVTELYLTTYARGCIGRDTTITRVRGLRVEVVPYQRMFVPAIDVACAGFLELERRTIRVTFPTAGDAVLRVVGRVFPDRGLVAIERRLVVK